MTVETLKQQLQQYGLKPNETYGQNFLLNEIVLQEMLESVPLKAGDALFEVGPGLGALTGYLCQTGYPVMSVEKDPKFLPVLEDLKKKFKNFQFEQEDILKFNLAKWAQDNSSYHVVANIPYYITGKIIQYFIASQIRPKTITLLVQKEVAENLSAKAGRLNLLAISVQLYGDVKKLANVLARDFYPSPKVDSAVIQIIFHDRPKYEVTNQKKFFALLRACFSGKRKQLHNTLANYLHSTKIEAENILKELKINSISRPQELTIEEWISLYNKVVK